MRHIPGLALALTLLVPGVAGCGAETPEEQAADREPTSAPPSPGNGPVEFDPVGVVSASEVGGEVAPRTVDLLDETALTDFLGQFEDERMATELEQAVAAAEVTDGQTLVGAVVAIGCVPPETVAVERTDAGLEMVAPPDKRSQQPEVQCLVPVTSVGVAAVEESLL